MRKKMLKTMALILIASMMLALAGCGNGAGGTSESIAGSPEPSAASDSDSKPTEAPDLEIPLEQENNDDSANEEKSNTEESKIEEYTLWTGTFTLYVGEHVFTNILQEEGYDAAGNMILEAHYEGIPNNGYYIDLAMQSDVLVGIRTRWAYDANGNVTKEGTCASNDVMNDDIVTWNYEYEYNAQGNLIKKSPPNYDSSYTAYEYDESGNLIREASVRGDQVGSWTEYEYDASGNLTREASGREDQVSNWTEYEYDASGNLTREASGSGDQVRHWRECEYDASGNLTSETSGEGDKVLYETKYEYDASGNLIKKMSQNGTSEEYEYDASGNLTKVTSLAEGGSVRSWIECEYAESDKRPPEIASELGLFYNIKPRNNPVKITWYDYDGTIEKEWEWTYEVIQ